MRFTSGVEDTTFEAKARHKKKSEAKYRPSRGQGLEQKVQVLSKKSLRARRRRFSAKNQAFFKKKVLAIFPQSFCRFPR